MHIPSPRCLSRMVVPLLLLIGACSGDVEELQPVTDSRFQPGQVWHYHTRPGEEGSLVVVGTVDQVPKVGRVVHVKVVGVSVKGGTGVSNVITHVPMRESALAESITTPADTSVDLDGFENGYNNWLDAYEGGNIHVFGKPLAQTLTDIERSLAP